MSNYCGQSEHEPPTQRKPKRVVGIIVGAIAVIGIIVLLLGLKSKPEQKPAAGLAANTPVGQFSTDVDFVLGRELFTFKEDFPALYTSSVNDFDTIIAYVENWAFRRVLNEQNFDEIEWGLNEPAKGAKIVSFKGKSKTMPYNTVVSIDFFIQEGASEALAWDMEIVSDKESTRMNLQSFLDSGMSEDTALVATDAAICSMIVFFAEGATDTVSTPLDIPSRPAVDVDLSKVNPACFDYYTDGANEVTIESDGTCSVSLYRLAGADGICVAVQGDKLLFEGKSVADAENVSWEIVWSDNYNKITVIITESSAEYLHTGEWPVKLTKGYMPEYSGEIIREVSDISYYVIKLEEPCVYNNRTYDRIALTGVLDGEMEQYLGSPVTVPGHVFEVAHGVLAIESPMVLAQGWRHPTPIAETPYTENIPRADQPIYSGPGYDYGYVATVEVAGIYTIVEEAWDDDGYLWGKLKSGVGWINLTDIRNPLPQLPISVNYADDIILPSGGYYEFGEWESDGQVRMAFTANETLTDLSFSMLNFGGNGYEIGEVLYTLPRLSPDDAFVANVYFWGDFTAYGISFKNAQGTTQHFMAVMSLRDGSLELTEFYP